MSAQVTSDGKTVWVNINGLCRGRFCKVSAEYGDENWNPLDFDVPPNWEVFIRKCSELFGVGPEQFEGHRPQWDSQPVLAVAFDNGMAQRVFVVRQTSTLTMTKSRLEGDETRWSRATGKPYGRQDPLKYSGCHLVPMTPELQQRVWRTESEEAIERAIQNEGYRNWSDEKLRSVLDRITGADSVQLRAEFEASFLSFPFSRLLLRYMADKGWGSNIKDLTIDQILEIRSQPEWGKL